MLTPMTFAPFFPFFRRVDPIAAPAPAPAEPSDLDIMRAKADELFRVTPDILNHAEVYAIVEAVYATLRPVLADRPDLLEMLVAEDGDPPRTELFFNRWSKVEEQARDECNIHYGLDDSAYHKAKIAWQVANLSLKLKFGDMRAAKGSYLTLWEDLQTQ